MTQFKVIKEYTTLYVRNRSSNYELRFKVVLKPNVKEPALLITKVFTKNGESIETTKLGRIPFSVLKEISYITYDSYNVIQKYLSNHG